MTTIADLIITLVVLVVLVGGGVWVHHIGYLSGQNERTAHYLPLMQTASDALAKANAHALAVEINAAAISQEQETQNEQARSTLASRVDAANGRIAELLRQLAASHSAARDQSVPAVSGPTTVSPGSSTSGQRDAEFGRRVSMVGGQCEHDADELAEFQRWYARQKANVEAIANK